MSCSRNKPSVKPKPDRFICTKCGVIAKKKKNVCEPKRIRKPK